MIKGTKIIMEEALTTQLIRSYIKGYKFLNSNRLPTEVEIPMVDEVDGIKVNYIPKKVEIIEVPRREPELIVPKPELTLDEKLNEIGD
jgi:hypothetical protein